MTEGVIVDVWGNLSSKDSRFRVYSKSAYEVDWKLFNATLKVSSYTKSD